MSLSPRNHLSRSERQKIKKIQFSGDRSGNFLVLVLRDSGGLSLIDVEVFTALSGDFFSVSKIARKVLDASPRNRRHEGEIEALVRH